MNRESGQKAGTGARGACLKQKWAGKPDGGGAWGQGRGHNTRRLTDGYRGRENAGAVWSELLFRSIKILIESKAETEKQPYQHHLYFSWKYRIRHLEKKPRRLRRPIDLFGFPPRLHACPVEGAHRYSHRLGLGTEPMRRGTFGFELMVAEGACLSYCFRLLSALAWSCSSQLWRLAWPVARPWNGVWGKSRKPPTDPSVFSRKCRSSLGGRPVSQGCRAGRRSATSETQEGKYRSLNPNFSFCCLGL